MSTLKILSRVFAGVFIILLSACALVGPAPTSTPVPLPSNTPVIPVTGETPTLTVAPTGTPAPTYTLQPTYTPLPTYTPFPTSTPFPSSTPASTFTPTATPLPCNAASFRGDVTVPDGTVFEPGTAFTKTWKLQNVGSCTWTTNYALVFVSGNSLAAPASVKLTSSVTPGQTANLSVSMVAPGTSGKYTSNWMLQNANGARFGVGASFNQVFWVKITVSQPEVEQYDFVANMCQALWRNSSLATLTCPGSAVDFTNGSITKTTSSSNLPTLVLVPDNSSNGQIIGRYPAISIDADDHLEASVGCVSASPQCNVTFKVDYRTSPTATVFTLTSWTQTTNNSFKSLDLGLSSLSGNSVEFFFIVTNNSGASTQVTTNWIQPEIVDK